MGLSGAKSLLTVKNGKSFLDIILEQVHHSGVQLALMNSFSTHEETLAALKKNRLGGTPRLFNQHKFPKILADSLRPAVWPQNPAHEWNPPGHGDVYTALYTSGMLQQLLDQGLIYAFISNSDNLGAAVDDFLLGYFAENRLPFMMEVAEKTPTDIKGGHLARRKNGLLVLREIAQCAEDDLEAFLDIHRYVFFNTNNIWINLEVLGRFFDREGRIHLPMIVNPKHLDPRDENSPNVFQIETAMGSAIELFEGATAVRVPRGRFLPVKKCNDLMIIRSDCLVFSDRGRLKINPERVLTTLPRIDLDPAYYGKIDRFEERFPQGVPSLLHCESLTVKGDVVFEKNVRIAGNVTISNPSNKPAIVEAGSLLEKDLAF